MKWNTLRLFSMYFKLSTENKNPETPCAFFLFHGAPIGCRGYGKGLETQMFFTRCFPWAVEALCGKDLEQRQKKTPLEFV